MIWSRGWEELELYLLYPESAFYFSFCENAVYANNSIIRILYIYVSFVDGPRPTQKEILSLRAFLLMFIKQLVMKVG